MKKCIAITITISLLLQCAVQLGIMGMYQLNKSYIAKNLCENKNKPKLKCNGKCQLSKELKKASRQQEKEHKKIQEEVATAYAFVVPAPWLPAVQYRPAALKHISSYYTPQGISFSADIFHPPQA